MSLILCGPKMAPFLLHVTNPPCFVSSYSSDRSQNFRAWPPNSDHRGSLNQRGVVLQIRELLLPLVTVILRLVPSELVPQTIGTESATKQEAWAIIVLVGQSRVFVLMRPVCSGREELVSPNRESVCSASVIDITLAPYYHNHIYHRSYWIFTISHVLLLSVDCWSRVKELTIETINRTGIVPSWREGVTGHTSLELEWINAGKMDRAGRRWT